MPRFSPLYKSYMVSNAWQRKRRLVKARSGGVCERCHVRPSLQVHHLTYARLGHELLTDLKDVCIACHRIEDRERKAKLAQARSRPRRKPAR